MKLLIAINTLGVGGAERALINFLRLPELADCSIDLRVMLEQGELIQELPDTVRLVNTHCSPQSVLTRCGRGRLLMTVLKDFLRRGSLLRNLPYMTRRITEMRRTGKVRIDKLLWKMVSDASPLPETSYDLAIAWLEGASTYYVADHVRAHRKIALVHVDYGMAGYTPALDHGCYEKIDQIFCVSGEVRRSFLRIYPEYADKTCVFHNIVDVTGIRRNALKPEGFTDGFKGTRILTVCRLMRQKQLAVSIEAMRLLKERHAGNRRIRWYVLGEGEDRTKLEKQIRDAGLSEDFLLPGVKKNPYPYFREADIYVHCTGYEGSSLAIEEAQILGKPIIVSDVSGNREQVDAGVDGLVVPLEAGKIADAVERLLASPEYARLLGENASKKDFRGGDLAELLKDQQHE
ncbi:MAG: glycosyltransferase [Lachnospira sp.]|nr:glycosyltransferase [Lachnospira sp.]